MRNLDNTLPPGPPPPFTEDEWFDLMVSVGYAGSTADGTLEGLESLQTAQRAAKALVRVIGRDYYAKLMARLEDKIEETP